MLYVAGQFVLVDAAPPSERSRYSEWQREFSKNHTSDKTKLLLQKAIHRRTRFSFFSQKRREILSENAARKEKLESLVAIFGRRARPKSSQND